jgi:hypothetical protein
MLQEVSIDSLMFGSLGQDYVILLHRAYGKSIKSGLHPLDGVLFRCIFLTTFRNLAKRLMPPSRFSVIELDILNIKT